MLKKIGLTLALSSVGFVAFAQIDTDNAAPNDTPNYLVNTVFLGENITVENITYSGNPQQIGYFSDGTPAPNTTLGFEEGVVMSTGDIVDLEIDGLSTAILGATPGDNDLLSVAQLVPTLLVEEFELPTSTNQAAILEFDFIPTTSVVTFQYAFSSNEWNDFIDTPLNDVIGIFASGPGYGGIYSAPPAFTNGSENLAVVPGTGLPNAVPAIPAMPITVSTIHPAVPGASIGALNELYYVGNQPENINIRQNGFTTVLEIEMEVECNERYHLKIAIADGNDSEEDSAIYLEGGSFKATGTSNIQEGSGNEDNVLVEGCDGGGLTFQLAAVNPVSITPITYTISGSATAGEDFEPLSGTAVVLPGEDSFFLPINAIDDGIDENDESIIIGVGFFNECISEYTFIVKDREDFELVMPEDEIVCPLDDDLVFTPELTGGVAPITTSWTYNGNFLPGVSSITVNPINVGTYTYTASDACGYTVSGSVIVRKERPEIPLSIDARFSDLEMCKGDYFQPDVYVVGGVGDYIYEWYRNGILVSNDNSYELQLAESGAYQLELRVNDNCVNSDSHFWNFEVKDCSFPNVFTPNGDFINDYFFINFGDFVDGVRLDVYNRWGEKVFASVNYEKCTDGFSSNGCWDGTNYNTGNACKEGIYYYIIEYVDGRKVKGELTLLR